MPVVITHDCVFIFQRYSTNTIILKGNEHKSYAWVFSVIGTFQSSQFFERLSMPSGVYQFIHANPTDLRGSLPNV